MSLSSTRGFTLIELMIVVVILVIGASLALPAFQSMIANNQVTTSSNELLTAINLARTEALKRGRPVAVCASDDGDDCSGDWSEGWIVVNDANRAGDDSIDEGEIIRIWPSLRGRYGFEGEGDLPEFVRYLPNGRAESPGTSFPLQFQLRRDDCEYGAARLITVVGTGRASVAQDDC